MVEMNLQSTKRKIRRIPFMGRVALFFTFVLSLASYSYLFYYGFLKNHTSETSYLEVDACPLCYGRSLCDDLGKNKAQFQGFSRLQILNALANLKNVNYGEYRGYPVVFKKLAHDAELQQFDDTHPKERPFPNVGYSKYVSVDDIQGISDFSKCPTDRLIDKVIFRYMEKADAVDISYPEKIHLLTTLAVNPEPIILQTFPAHEGWPFPKYYGACGRFVVVENGGKSLGEFYDAPWPQRVSYALQILKIAEQLTENNVKFSLYFTDVGYDNFAVSEDGKVTVIDAENIIVVDKWQIEKDKTPDYDTPFYSDFDTCSHYGNCLTVQPNKLCTRLVCDFNYYAVCRDLLSSYASDVDKPGGLLYGTPTEYNDRFELDKLLEQCAKPDKPGDRLTVKDKLLEVLTKIKKEVF